MRRATAPYLTVSPVRGSGTPDYAAAPAAAAVVALTQEAAGGGGGAVVRCCEQTHHKYRIPYGSRDRALR